MQEIPSVFRHDSALGFIRAQVDFLKSNFGADSLREWAQALGLKSRITFRHVLTGRRALTPLQLEGLQQSLDMSQAEQLEFQKKRDVETKEEAQSPEAGSAASPKAFYVSEEFFATPLHTIVLNLCGVSKAMNLMQIKKVLKGAFSEEDIERSVDLLVSLKLVEKRQDESLCRIFEGSISSIPGKKSKTSQEYFKKTYALAERAWEYPLSIREMSAFTFRIRNQDLGKIKELARNFRNEVASLSTKEEATSVYQCSLAIFPILFSED